MEIKIELIKTQAEENNGNRLTLQTIVDGKEYIEEIVLCDAYEWDDSLWKVIGDTISEHWEKWVRETFNEEVIFI